MNTSAGEDLPEFQYELLRAEPSEALQTWLALQREGQGIFSPVILDSPENYQLEEPEFAALQESLSGILAASASISVQEFFRRRRAEIGEDSWRELESGEWPAAPFKYQPYLPGQLEEVFIVKTPTPHSYNALAFIGFGGWNDCPTDEEHVAVLRYWHERYGANLFSQGSDMIELVVDRPPTTREAAIQLAREQLAYALGTLSNFGGVEETVPNLAATLLNSRHWIFWWD